MRLKHYEHILGGEVLRFWIAGVFHDCFDDMLDETSGQFSQTCMYKIISENSESCLFISKLWQMKCVIISGSATKRCHLGNLKAFFI